MKPPLPEPKAHTKQRQQPKKPNQLVISHTFAVFLLRVARLPLIHKHKHTHQSTQAKQGSPFNTLPSLKARTKQKFRKEKEEDRTKGRRLAKRSAVFEFCRDKRHDAAEIKHGARKHRGTSTCSRGELLVRFKRTASQNTSSSLSQTHHTDTTDTTQTPQTPHTHHKHHTPHTHHTLHTQLPRKQGCWKLQTSPKAHFKRPKAVR